MLAKRSVNFNVTADLYLPEDSFSFHLIDDYWHWFWNWR